MDTPTEAVSPDVDLGYIPMPPTSDPAPDKSPGQELEEWLRGMIGLLLARAMPPVRQGHAYDEGKPALVVTTEHGTFVVRVAKVSGAVLDGLR